MHYSLLGRDVERDVVPMMRRYGLGMTVWSPLASGFLSGKYTRAACRIRTTVSPDSTCCRSTRSMGFRWSSVCARSPREHAASVAQAAVAWLLAKKEVSSVLIGASKLNQLDDNLGAANVTLTEAEMAELDAATALSPVYPNWFIERLQDEVTTKALAPIGVDHAEGGVFLARRLRSSLRRVDLIEHAAVGEVLLLRLCPAAEIGDRHELDLRELRRVLRRDLLDRSAGRSSSR